MVDFFGWVRAYALFVVCCIQLVGWLVVVTQG